MDTSFHSASNTENTRLDLSYIESLISGATQQGLFSITVPNNKIDDTMADVIRTYGYDVYKKNSFLGENYDYVISWLNSLTGQTNGTIEVANNAYDLRIHGIKINGVDVTFIHGTNFIMYPNDSGTFNTNETGLVSVQIRYEVGVTTPQSIQITDSDNTVQCLDTTIIGGVQTLMEFVGVQMGVNPIYIEALATNC